MIRSGLPYLLLAILLIGVGGYAGHWIMERGRAELRPTVAQLERDLASERAARKRAEEISNAYATELDGLRSRPVPAAPVRLCRAPAVPRTPSAPEGAAGPSAPAGGGVGPTGADSGEGAGPDIGPELRGLALQCDKENAKLRALQQWAGGLGN